MAALFDLDRHAQVLLGRLLEEFHCEAAFSACPQRQQRDSEIGVEVAAWAIIEERTSSGLELLLAGRSNSVVCAASRTGLAVAHEACLNQSLKRRNRCTLGQAGRLL